MPTNESTESLVEVTDRLTRTQCLLLLRARWHKAQRLTRSATLDVDRAYWLGREIEAHAAYNLVRRLVETPEV